MFDIQHPCWNVRWSPDGRWIAVQVEMQASDYGMFLLSTEDGSWRQIEYSGQALNAIDPAWSPDSKGLAFSAESDEWLHIGLLDVETGEICWVTQSTGDDTSPCWSPDGRLIGWVHAEGAATSLMVQE